MPQLVYADVHVPLPLVEGLRGRGMDVLTAQQDGTTEVADADLLERAASLHRVLITEDRDFIQITADWVEGQRILPGVIILILPSRKSNEEVLDCLQLLLDADQFDNPIEFAPF